MRISVEARPGAKQAKVVALGEGQYRVSIDAPAKENKANMRLLALVAEYFKVPISAVRFVSGVRGRHKVLIVDGR